MTTELKERPPMLDIPMRPVESSQIAAVGYSTEHQVLAVRFKHGAGATYHYPGTTAAEYDAFVSADSLGTHFGKHIKSKPFHKYPKA